MDKALEAAVEALRLAIIRAMDYAGTLPAKEAVKLRPADWHAVIDLGRELADKVVASTALPATDTSGLVNRLRALGSRPELNGSTDGPETCREAADALAAKGARLAEAEAVIRPFARIARLFDHLDDDGGSVMSNVRLGDLRAARSYLEGRK